MACSGVADRYVGIAVGHAVLQDYGCDAVALEEFCPVVAFLLHGEMLIATTGTYHDGASCGCALLRKVDTYLGSVLRVAVVVRWATVVSNIENFLGHASHGECQQSKGKEYFVAFHNLLIWLKIFFILCKDNKKGHSFFPIYKNLVHLHL